MFKYNWFIVINTIYLISWIDILNYYKHPTMEIKFTAKLDSLQITQYQISVVNSTSILNLITF